MRVVGACVWLFAIVVLVSCDGQPEQGGRLEAKHDTIIGGAPDPNETGTVIVTHWDYPFLCSGTLIASTLVVTAKHCVLREVDGSPDVPLAGDRFRVGFGAELNQASFRSSSRMEWIGMPGELEVQPSVDSGQDVALIWLSSAAPVGSRIHEVKLDYAPVLGEPITIVGYGESSLAFGSSGVKLTTSDVLDAWEPATGILQTTGKGACSGDSGGSFFWGATRALVGVTSTAAGSSSTSFCDVGITQASSVRNGRVAKLLSDALGAVGVCSPQAEICGNATDEDCDGIADNQCKKIGEACSSETDCASGACVDTGAGPVCVRTCGDRQPCPSGTRCVQSCDGGYCVPGSAGGSELLEACSSDADCATDHCATVGCTTRCNPLLGQCADDMACDLAGSSPTCGECVPVAEAGRPRRVGEACVEDADCAEGRCRDDGFGVRRCAGPCLVGRTCPAGFVCNDGLCIRGAGLLAGERCQSAAQCESGLCALFRCEPWLDYCTRTCAVDDDCSEGFACRDELGARHCVPVGTRMGQPCDTDDQCLTGRCEPALGVCTRACSPTAQPCPPGFACQLLGAELACVPGPKAWPSSAEPSQQAGLCNAGGAAGAAGAGPDLTPVQQSDDGCGCRTASRVPGGAGFAVIAVYVLLALVRCRSRQRVVTFVCALFSMSCSSGKSGPQAGAGGAAGTAPEDASFADADTGAAGAYLEGRLDGSACVPPTPASTCGTFPQCGCAAGEKCDLTNLETGLAECVPDDVVLPQQTCLELFGLDCARGSTCLGSVCRLFCAEAADCPGERRECVEVTLDRDGGALTIPGLRICTAACDPLDPQGTCGVGLTCSFTSATGPGTDCYAAGVGVGPGACATGALCAPGYSCVNLTDCLKWCRVGNANDCPTGQTCAGIDSAPVIAGSQYGVCV